jgi:cytochrome c oxidase subunit 3
MEPLPQPRLLIANTVFRRRQPGDGMTVFSAPRRHRPVRSGCGQRALTIAFLIGQLVVWRQLADAGYFMATSAATAFFYLLTAVHGVHVLGGLVAWGRSSVRAFGGADPARIRLGVELCAIYWHFLLVIWVVLFAVLVSNYLGLSICSPTLSL